MKPNSARQRGELIMKVRCGILTAKQAAAQLGVSRKTYYKWEQRGLAALLQGLDDQQAGRTKKPQRETELAKQLARSQAEIAARRSFLEDMLARSKEADISTTTAVNNVRVIEPARPPGGARCRTWARTSTSRRRRPADERGEDRPRRPGDDAARLRPRPGVSRP